jgi:Cytochrome c7 and related cytochrome c/Cytochrome c554 and c-prime
VPELGVVAVLLALAGSLAALAARSAPRNRPALLALLGALAVAVVVAALAIHRDPPPPPQPEQAPLQVAAPGDTTSTACRACHPEQYETWHASYHRTMTQTAKPETALGDFGDARVEYGGARYRLFERDGDLFGAIEGARSTTLRLYQTTGSHHMQIYWYATGEGRMLESFPLVWLREQQRWIPRAAAFVMPPSDEPAQSSTWNYTCIGCHTTHPSPRIALYGQAHADSHVTELGIACEACHGGGADHAEANRSPLRRYQEHWREDPDATVVNPARLPHVRSAQVCGQCHSVRTFYSAEQASEWADRGPRFRPGEDLEAAVSILSKATLSRPFTQQIMEEYPDFVRGSFWDDGIVRVAGREYNALLESGCFQRGELACVSCHTMHQAPGDPRSRAEWADDQLAPGMQTDRACTQCHERFAVEATATEHAHHEPGSSGSECQNCHMPHTTYGLLKAVRSHEIGSPRVIAAGPGSARPNACNLCHLDRPLAWSAEHLARWYGHAVPALAPDDRQVAAGVRWALAGDAGARALTAWALGWGPAQQASGTGWSVPYLIELMDDPYDAVRMIAARSLTRVPGFERAEFDPLARPERRAAAAQALHARWAELPEAPADRSDATLYDAHGELRRADLARLRAQRDDRPLTLAE